MKEKDSGYRPAHHGLDELDFMWMDEELKTKILVWMSRIMERAYRRGVQQALHMQKRGRVLEEIIADLHAYRYGASLDISPGLDGFTTPSLKRLGMEEKTEYLEV